MENHKCRQCRKFGTKLFLKGARCLLPNCSFTRRNYAPGVQGVKGRMPRRSEYGIQLFEKQKAKAIYGMRERQFAKFFRNAAKSKTATGEQLLRLLEKRFDNVVYRLGWANSRKQARQLVSHQKIKLNDKIVNIPSIILKPKDILESIATDESMLSKSVVPAWLKSDQKKLQARVLREPKMEEIESDIDKQLIVEFYSR